VPATVSSSDPAREFHSREWEAELLAGLLRTTRLTLLLGAAGSGKTTLLTGGVMPALGSGPDGARQFVIVFDTWQQAPLAALGAQIQDALAAKPGAVPCPPLSERSMTDYLTAWSGRLGISFLIIFDQFEQYLAAPMSQEGVAAFADQFIQAANQPGLPVNFLLSLREDAEPLLARFQDRIPGLYNACVRLPPFSLPPPPPLDFKADEQPLSPPPFAAAPAPAPEAPPASPVQAMGRAEDPAPLLVRAWEKAAPSPLPPADTTAAPSPVAAKAEAAPTVTLHTEPPAVTTAPVEERLAVPMQNNAIAEESLANLAAAAPPGETTPADRVKPAIDLLQAEAAGSEPSQEPPTARERRSIGQRSALWFALPAVAVLAGLVLWLPTWRPEAPAVPPRPDAAAQVRTEDRTAVARPPEETPSKPAASQEQAAPSSPAASTQPGTDAGAVAQVAAVTPVQQSAQNGGDAPTASQPAVADSSAESRVAAATPTEPSPPAPNAQQPPAAPAQESVPDTPAKATARAVAPPGPLLVIIVRSPAQEARAQRLIKPLAKKGVRVTDIKLVKRGPPAPDLRYFRVDEADEARRVARALRGEGVRAELKQIAGYETSAVPRQYELWFAAGR
jgi:hypothetical protein